MDRQLFIFDQGQNLKLGEPRTANCCKSAQTLDFIASVVIKAVGFRDLRTA